MFAEALRASNEDRLSQAEELCGRILAVDPNHGRTLNLLGIVVARTGRDELAVELLRRAVRSSPSVACFHNSLGAFLQKIDQTEEAVSEYRQAIDLAPEYVDPLINLGRLLSDLGRPEGALPYVANMMALAPADATVRTSLGDVLHALGRPEEGEQHFRKALELAPQSVDVVRNCIATLMKAQRWTQTIPFLERWVELEPANADPRLGLGDCYFHQDLQKAAAAHYAKALELDPQSAKAANNLGTCLLSECHHGPALAFLRMAAELQPDCVNIWPNLGKVLREVGLVETALRCYDSGLALEPELAQARWGRSLCLLALGRLAEGWTEYEWGWKAGARTPVRPFSHPYWNGEDLAGKTILVWMEQGLGDIILFASLVPDLIRAGAHCIVESEWRLTGLFQRSFPEAEVVLWTDPPQARTLQPDVDFQIPVASLARWFRPTLDSFPQEPAYLVPDPVRAGEWKQHVDALGNGLKVGICWRSMLNKGPRAMHYSQLNEWGPILTTPGVQFINLQYDQCEEELCEAEGKFGVPIYRWTEFDLRNDQDGVAALISTLDVVISAGTAVASMGGAVGIPTWVLAINAGDWTCLGQDYNPWQRSERRFYRGNNPWMWAIQNVAAELRQLSQSSQVSEAIIPDEVGVTS